MNALQFFMDTLKNRLTERVPTTMKNVGPLQPYYVAEIPAITISLANLNDKAIGVGSKPRNLMRGALAMELNLNLSDPVVIFPDETVNLLSADRLSVQLPHQPLVDKNGGVPAHLGPDDLQITLNGTGLTIVAGPPTSGECRLNPATGQLDFISPLPASGTLQVRYFIGQWEVESSRFTGHVTFEIYANNATDTEQLSKEVAAVLALKPPEILTGLTELKPLSWGPIVRPGRPSGQTKLRSLSYSFTFDFEQPIISTGGGPIRTIDVRSTMGPEQFLLT